MPTTHHLVTLLLCTFLGFAPGCNDSGTPPVPPVPPVGRVPVQHRPTAGTCAMTRPPGPAITATTGMCTKDADCADGTKGKNGRCTFSRIGATCSYDTCFDDSTCNGKVCQCRAQADTASSDTNHCLSDGNCKVDADCGAGGYCSPSLGSCGTYGGVVAYFCHTGKDKCTDDSDCNVDGGLGGYCAYDPPSGTWLCSNRLCAG